jgi:hypothetical protein
MLLAWGNPHVSPYCTRGWSELLIQVREEPAGQRSTPRKFMRDGAYAGKICRHIPREAVCGEGSELPS